MRSAKPGNSSGIHLCDIADVSNEAQEGFLERKVNSSAEEDLKNLDLGTFSVKYLPGYPLILYQALGILTTFGSTYLRENVFSTLIAIKTKYISNLNVEGDLSCALSGIRPRIQDLEAKKQFKYHIKCDVTKSDGYMQVACKEFFAQ